MSDVVLRRTTAQPARIIIDSPTLGTAASSVNRRTAPPPSLRLRDVEWDGNLQSQINCKVAPPDRAADGRPR